jgi:arylsulfatase A-like enzyme
MPLPHLLIFNPDQWRGDVMGHLGNPAAVTPVIDRLVATEAVSFRNAFCQNPVCTPSRCSFMSGWYPHVRGHRTMFHMLHAEQGEPVLLKTLKNAGYFVWWGGKNDLVPGKDSLAPFCDVKYQPVEPVETMWRGDHAEEWRGEPGGDAYYSFYSGKLPHTSGRDHYHDSDWAHVEGALDLIRTYDGDRPLCIYLPLSYPHPPYAVEEPWYSRIDRAALPPRLLPPEGWNGKPSILPRLAELHNMQGWDEARWDELRAVYYGMCARLDTQFGLLIEALRERGFYDDTAVFLFADHGDFCGDYGLVEKTQNTFEDCLARVPFILKPPKGVALRPGVRDALVELIDFPATVEALTGLEPQHTHFGRSLLPLLADRGAVHRDAVFCEGGRLFGETQAMEIESNPQLDPRMLYWPRMTAQRSEQGEHTKAAMCRTSEFKYVRRHYESDELYDLRADPGETINLVDDPAYAAVLAGMKERMLAWYMETCDVVPRSTDPRW